MQKIAYFIIIFVVTVTHFLVTLVVDLFLLSTLNIINEDKFHMENLQYAEIAVTAAIFIISIFIYLRSYGKLSSFIRNTFFNRPF